MKFIVRSITDNIIPAGQAAQSDLCFFRYILSSLFNILEFDMQVLLYFPPVPPFRFNGYGPVIQFPHSPMICRSQEYCMIVGSIAIIVVQDNQGPSIHVNIKV